MRTLFSIFCVVALFCTTTNLNAQDSQDFTIEKVIPADGLTKAEIYTKARAWFAETYRSSKDVLQVEDKEAGMLLGKGTQKFSMGKLSYLAYDGYLNYTIKVLIKDNRFKVILQDFVHENMPGNAAQCNLGRLTTAENYATKGLAKKHHNKTWARLKTDAQELADRLMASLEESMTKETAKEGDDW